MTRETTLDETMVTMTIVYKVCLMINVQLSIWHKIHLNTVILCILLKHTKYQG